MQIALFLKYAFYWLVFILIAGYVSFKLYEPTFYKNAIPEQFEIEEILKIKSETWITGGCGGVIFKISDSTKNQVLKNGLNFLDKDLHGRGYKEVNRERYYYTYEPWVETPINIKGGIASGLNCLLQKDNHIEDDSEIAPIVRNAVKQKGSYYTKKREGELLLIPSMGLLFFAYSG
ncbi:MAG: hypothetical protein PHX61_03060 [Alphaproteobacteria bacterium]|nr:hypothetical protein [Alphaproteobacteria bacterium]